MGRQLSLDNPLNLCYNISINKGQVSLPVPFLRRKQMTSTKEYAYAKINLCLDVTAKRPDGFHEVRTVMHTVSLADELTVSVLPSSEKRVRMTIEGDVRLPADSRNLAYRAAELFLTETLIIDEVNIKLKKNIPIAAGLAGGSSDAAAVLRALNRLYKRPLTEKRLLELSAALGSDVPFCLVGGTALCLGRGENIERLPDSLSLHTVIAISDERVSTPAAYARLDELFSDFEVPRIDSADALCQAIISVIESGNDKLPKLYNIFENAILPICSKAENIKRELARLGATHALMSGSGPSVYGIFENEKNARAAEESLKANGIRAYYAHSIQNNAR